MKTFTVEKRVEGIQEFITKEFARKSNALKFIRFAPGWSLRTDDLAMLDPFRPGRELRCS